MSKTGREFEIDMCECPELEKLRYTRNLLERLVNKCERLGSNVDLENPSQEDRNFLEHYRKLSKGLEKAKKFYDLEINRGVDKGVLVVKKSQYGNRAKELKKEDFKLISCFNCETIIDYF